MRRLPVVLIATLAIAACARSVSVGTTPAQRGLDPVGTFDFTTVVEGQSIGGTVTIVRQPAPAQGYAGSIATQVSEPLPIQSIVVEERTIRLVATAPQGEVLFVLNFAGDNEFTGSWSLGGMAGTVAGRRRTG